MKNLVGLALALGIAFFAGISTPESRLARLQGIQYAEATHDICVPEVGPVCVCRTCVYNDDGTCSCPAEL